jgi:hypothetical protein
MLQHLKYLGVGLIIFGTGLALVMSAYLGFVLITDYLTPEYMLLGFYVACFVFLSYMMGKIYLDITEYKKNRY